MSRCNAILIGIAAVFLLCLATGLQARNPNSVQRNVYVCGMDRDIEELLMHAIQIQQNGDHATALDIYKKILSIRPNCHDVYRHMALSHGILGKDREFNACMRKADELQREYERYAPRKEEAYKKEPVISIIVKEPPRKEKINYWKWLFIYSLIRK